MLSNRWDAWDKTTPATTIAGIIADVLWMLAYIFAIRAGFRDHTYGIPMLAVCLNFSWEFVFSIVIRPASKLRLMLTLLWLAIDTVILYQLLRWGRADQIPQLQPYFVPIVIGTLILAIIGHITFYRTFEDPGGQEDAFAINLIMSVLFVFMFFERPDMRGLSYATAWLKMIGTFILSVANFTFMRSEMRKYGFFVFLFCTIFLFDVIYVYLMTQARMGG